MRRPISWRSIEVVASPRSRWSVVALFAAAILFVPVIPIPGSIPEEGSGIPTSLLFHFVGYAALAALLGFALFVRRTSLYSTTLSIVGATLYGILIEYIQYPIPYRSFSYLDMLGNGAGAAFGAVVLAILIARSE